jgi:D-serine deaminase-like pyridoxal phosphate-dependent protein
MCAHAYLPAVQEAACGALHNGCLGTGDNQGLARKKAGSESGALHVVVAATRTPPTTPAVQAMTCGAICSIGLSSDVRDRLALSLTQLWPLTCHGCTS